VLSVIKEITKNHLNNTKQENAHVKNLKRQLMINDFLWRLKLHVGNWNEWSLVLRT